MRILIECIVEHLSDWMNSSLTKAGGAPDS